MFAFFRTKSSQSTNGRNSVSPSVPSRNSQMRTATQRELVRVVMRDTLRMHGIPLDWIGCDMLNLSHRAGDNSLLIQLVIRHWHEGLLRFAPAFQQQLMQGLQRFDPAADHSRHEVVWRFSPDCGCPHTTMPNPEYWSAPPAVANKAAFDLPDTVTLNHPTSGNDWAPTVPGKLS